MYLMLNRFLMIMLTASLLILGGGINPAEAARHKKHTVQPQPDRFAEIVIEASTGYVLSERNADKVLYPASLSKMMTLYLTFDAIERGALRKNQMVTVSKRAASQEPSSLGLQPGESIRVEDAILAIATKSANDCAVTLAEAVGGSESHFAALMTAKARQLGMTHTHFVNASGLFNPGQVSSARDISILAQSLIHDHPRYYHYFSTDSFTYAGNTYMNHNRLMNIYPGMDGFKTGYVYASGYNLASSAVRNGTRLIGVVFGGKTAGIRNNIMAQLLDRGFASVSNIRVAELAPQQRQHPMPARRTVIVPDPAPDAAEVAADNAPQFNPTGMIVDQGDTETTDGDSHPEKDFVAAFQPRTLNTTPLTTDSGGTGWAIQIGAFASHDAGAKALQFAKTSLRGLIAGVDTIAPLMTSRGMIYRARLSGLARNDATHACRILKGNCLILTDE